MLYVICKYIIGTVMRIFVHPIVYGMENLRFKGPAIIVSNHISMSDPILIAIISPRFVHFMAKKELFDSKICGALLRSMLAFPVNRKNVDIQSLKAALEVLNQGKVFGIFPEGKRSVTNDMDEFEKGAAFFAIRSGAPVIPIYLHPASYRSLCPKIMVGKAIDINDIVANSKKSELVNVVTDEIADSIRALRREMEELCS